MMPSRAISSYARFVSEHPFIVLSVMLLVTYAAFGQMMNVNTESESYDDMIPDSYEVINAMMFLNDEFGGTQQVRVVMELDTKYKDSDEIRDMRHPEALRYMDVVSQQIELIDNVQGADSAADIYKDLNRGYLPQSLRLARELSKDSPFIESYISDEYHMALINVQLSDTEEYTQLESDLRQVIETTERPSGIKASLSGEAVESPIIQRLLGPDMSRTSTLSMVAIVLLLLIIFRSIRYTILPLSTIIFGIVWAMGFIGLIGMGLTTTTSGVISMVMGIGIDFGIQNIVRYKNELENKIPKKAIRTMLEKNIMPIMTTTVSALIGFKAMTLGELSMMGELGTIMSYGVAACFVASVTVLPALILIIENFRHERGN